MQTVTHAEPAIQAAIAEYETQQFSHDNMALLRFAHDIATHYRLEPLAVVDVFCTSPQSFLDLARDPVGLTALASMVAGQLGTEVAAPFMVALH